MPYADFELLSDHGKHTCREVVAPRGAPVLGVRFVHVSSTVRAAHNAADARRLGVAVPETDFEKRKRLACKLPARL
jgi:hypothetical protein